MDGGPAENELVVWIDDEKRRDLFAGRATKTSIQRHSGCFCRWGECRGIFPPATGSRQALVLVFPRPLDWALLLRTITIGSAAGTAIDGQVAVDQCERRWSFTPISPWRAGVYHIRVGSSLEDVCGNTMAGPFDRPLRKGPNLLTEINGPSLIFHLIDGPLPMQRRHVERSQ